MAINLELNRDVLFEFHLKFWNTGSIGIPVRSLLCGRQTSSWSSCSQKGTTARWDSNKTSLTYSICIISLITFISFYIQKNTTLATNKIEETTLSI